MKYVKKWFKLSLIITFSLFLLTSVSITQNISHNPIKQDSNNKLDSNIKGLIESSDRKEYAKNHSIDYKNGKAKLVVEVKKNTDIPTGYNISNVMEYTGQDQNLLQGYIPVDQIKSLSGEENVKNIRLPMEAQPANDKSNNNNTKNTDNIDDSNENNTQQQNSILGSLIPSLALISLVLLYSKNVRK